MQTLSLPRGRDLCPVRATLGKHISHTHLPLPGWILAFCCGLFVTHAALGEPREGCRWIPDLPAPAHRDQRPAAPHSPSQGLALPPAAARTNRPRPAGGAAGGRRGQAGERGGRTPPPEVRGWRRPFPKPTVPSAARPGRWPVGEEP